MWLKVWKWLVVAASGLITVNGMEITYEQHARFPTLFQLDSYADCLGPEDGLYCEGTFHIRSLKEHDATYELMKEYSLDGHNFNRTLLHRGYCVSSSCPSLSHIPDVSLRFERCVGKYMRSRSFKAMLIEFSYCRSHAEEYPVKNDKSLLQTSHLAYLYILMAIFSMNVIGTVYDVMKKSDKSLKSKFLTSWSVKSNWPQLVGPYPDGDPRLAALLPVEGFRVIMITLVVFTHAAYIHDILYLANPKEVEVMSHHWIMMLLQNGSSSIQLFLLLSSFLLAQSLLDRSQLTLGIVTKRIVKRIFRIMPVYVLVLGFAATWWPLMNNGPLWHSTVGIESQVCRRKFWAHMFFLHNFFEPNRHCLTPTWFLAVDMQLYIAGCIIMLCLSRLRRFALPLLAVGFVTTVVLNSCLAYIYHWKPLMFVSGPENIRHMYQKEPSFYEYYINPIGSMPSVFVGLFMAYLYRHLDKNGFKPADHKWLNIICQMMAPLVPVWTTSGHFWRNYTSREFTALYIAFERPVILLLGGAMLFGAYNGINKKEINKITPSETTAARGNQRPSTATKGFMKHIFCWRIWYPLGRSSLSVLMLHWCVNMIIKACILQPMTSSAIEMISDTAATLFFTYLLSLPTTLLIEIPFTKLYSVIFSSTKQD